MRDLSPDFAAAIQSRAVTPALFVYLDFQGDPLRAWTGVGPVEWSGHTWLGFGMLAEVEPVEEYSDIRSGSVALKVNKVPSAALSGLADLVYKRRAAEIHLALFDGDSRNLLGVELLLRGTMDTLDLDRQPDGSTLRVTVANELARLRDSWGALYTDAHQRSAFSGDTALRFVASLQDVTIKI